MTREGVKGGRHCPLVTEKTDGVRHLLLVFVADDGQFYSLLIDRGFRFYYTNLKFAQWVSHGTLFDGEIVLEASGPKFYIHDLVCLAGKTEVALSNYRDRMRLVVDTLRWSSFPPDEGDPLVSPLPKQIYPLSSLATLCKTIVPSLPHKSDGYILTPNELPHTGKKNKFLFK